MTVKERALLVTKRLDEFYTKELTCYLNHDSAWQLLFATILSAQCTDARVNIVTEKLFKKYRKFMIKNKDIVHGVIKIKSHNNNYFNDYVHNMAAEAFNLIDK